MKLASAKPNILMSVINKLAIPAIEYSASLPVKKFNCNNATFIRNGLLQLRSAIMAGCYPYHSELDRKSSDWGWLPLPFNQTAIADELKKRGGGVWTPGYTKWLVHSKLHTCMHSRAVVVL